MGSRIDKEKLNKLFGRSFTMSRDTGSGRSCPAAAVGNDDGLESFALSGEEDEFDFSSVVPKSEIEATEFLVENPEFDGRGSVIAIFDTGVDPGGHGLSVTTTGEKKVIDVVDCTGSGDVDTSIVREGMDENGCIKGVYGNPLKVNAAWENPTGKWHVGSKRLFELYPEGLRVRMKKERKKVIDECQSELVTKASLELSAFNKENPTVSNQDQVLKRRKEELETRLELLGAMSKKLDDFGPSIECVVWHDGERWLAALDTQEIYRFCSDTMDGVCGLLEDFEPLTNYRECKRFGTFSPMDACNFALNIYDEGNTLSVVVDAGSHGTHVAGISAAYHPEDTALNGIAPGAKIVSCKIGDTRLGSMETMTGLSRAVSAVLENKCDLINMSYGEAAAAPNSGRFVRLAEELVYNHGVIFVASAGNAGPALSTVGAPGGTSSSIMGIGAYVTPDLAKTGHSVRIPIESGAQYTWSSRGPAIDGDLGISISAPGGAIAPVPQWTTQRKQLMNGTSMASPCACGGLALIVSAMKASGMAISPALVRRAVENTALFVHLGGASSPLTYGNGLLQVRKAWEYLRRGQGTMMNDDLGDLRFDISVKRSDGHTSGRGIYLRNPADSSNNRTFMISVKPELHQDSDVRNHRLSVDLKLRLTSTADWVVCPSMLMLHYNGRSFEVEVNCEKLDYGLHYAEIQAIDTKEPWRGPLFRLPVCVIKPYRIYQSAGKLFPENASTIKMNGSSICFGDKKFTPGLEDREFIEVPEGSTWAQLTIRPIEIENSMACMVRATALVPHTRYSDTEYRSFVRINNGVEQDACFSVIPGSTLELTISQFWSSFGKNNVSVDLTFHGVSVEAPKPWSFAVDGSAWPVKLMAQAAVRSETLKPSLKFDKLRLFSRPSSSELKVLSGNRNKLPGNKTIHSLELKYEFNLAEGGKITPCLPAINNYVYDGELAGQMVILCNRNEKVLGVGDIYAETTQVQKGEHKVYVCLKHEDPTFLETFKDIVLQIDRKIETPINVPIHGTYSDAIKGRSELSKVTLAAGENLPLFVGKIADDKMPKDASPGRILVGFLHAGVKNDGKAAPGSYQIAFTIPPKKADVTKKDESPEKEEVKNLLEKAIRDAKVRVLQDIPSEQENEYFAMYDSMSQEYPDHLPLFLEELKRAKGAFLKEGEPCTREKRLRAIEAINKINSCIDKSELAIFLAKKCHEDGVEASKQKKEMEAKKEALITALSFKLEILLRASCDDTSTEKEKIDRAFMELREWVDTAADSEYLILHAKKESFDGRHAMAIKSLNKVRKPFFYLSYVITFMKYDCLTYGCFVRQIVDGDDAQKHAKEAHEIRRDLLQKLKWDCWHVLEAERLRKEFPSTKPVL